MTAPRYTPEEDAIILRLRAEGVRWALITWALGKGHTPGGIERRWQKLMLIAKAEAAEAAAGPRVRIVVPVADPPKSPLPTKSYWPDGWTIRPPTKEQLMGKK